MAISPNADQFAAYAQSGNDGEVVMLNLLKFKAVADRDGGTGAAAYGRYGDAVVEMIEARGGSVVWYGRPDHVFIGDVEDNDWDAVALVSYPSRQAFLDMVATPDYRDAHEHREQGLERTVVIACTPVVDRTSAPS